LTVDRSAREVDPDQPVYDLRLMREVVARSAAEKWLNMALLRVFALSSLMLASVGLYGVIAHGVTERAPEFGVRLALGATRAELSRLVLVKGSALAGCGVPVGLGGAIALTLSIKNLLYGITPSILSASSLRRPCSSRSRSWRVTFRPGARLSPILQPRFGRSDEGKSLSEIGDQGSGIRDQGWSRPDTKVTE
jgi:ABC-type antimicrobial peptide transport system permease subunit